MRSNRPGNDGGIGILRLRGLSARFRESLFFLPAIFVVGSAVLGLTMVELDKSLSGADLPGFLASTVDNARSILSTVAGGTIGAASVVFSLTLVAVQLAASQFSPRVVRGFLGDRFQQVVIGIVVGTFTYSLMVLRVVQDPTVTSNTAPFLPQLSVLLAVVLAVASLLAVLGSIDHTAKSLRVGSLLDQVAAETVRTIKTRYQALDSDEQPGLVLDAPLGTPLGVRNDADIPEGAYELRTDRVGWVTQISVEGLVDVLPKEAAVRLVSPVGRYLTEDALMAYVWSDDDLDWPRLEDRLRDVIEIRSTRTLQQDVAFGILQLTDIAMRALSPGVNDPNTAVEAVARTGAVITTLLRYDVGPRVMTKDRRRIERGWTLTTADYVQAAIEPVRRYGAEDPVVLQAIIRMLDQALASARARSAFAIDDDSVRRQLHLVRADLDRLPTAEARQAVDAELRAVGA